MDFNIFACILFAILANVAKLKESNCHEVFFSKVASLLLLE